MEEAKKMKCYKRLIFKQFFQVSGLCRPQFLSYLPKRFTHLCRALCGDAILVNLFGKLIRPPEINKNIFICRNVSRIFVELCMETPYWCTVLVHQYGRRKSTKTSGVHLFYKSSFFSLEN